MPIFTRQYLKEKLQFALLGLLILPATDLHGSRAASPSRLADSEIIGRIDSIVISQMKLHQVPGIVIGVGQGDSQFVRPYGLADVENSVTMRADASFRIASITKAMTSVAVMQMAERGLLSLDDDIQSYVPAFPHKQWKVTVRALLGHLGGVTDYQGEEEERLTRDYTTAESIQIFAERPLAIQPGTDFFYSNYGYNLLGGVIEQRSGVAYDVYMRNNVWSPVGMTSTQLDRPEVLIQHRVRGYSLVGTQLRNSDHVNITSRSSAGGTRGTVGDLVRFGRAIYDGQLLSPLSYDEMWKTGRTQNGQTTGYGLGWELMTGGGAFAVGHTGAQPETSTALIVVPQRRIAVAVAANLERFDARHLAEMILASLTDIHPRVAVYSTRLGDKDTWLAGMQSALSIGKPLLERTRRAPPIDANLRAAFRRWNSGNYSDAGTIGAFMTSRLGATPTPDAYIFFAAYSRLDGKANNIPAWAKLKPSVAAELFEAWPGWENLAGLSLRDRLLDASQARPALLEFERAINGRTFYPDWSDAMMEAMRYHSLRGADDLAIEIGNALNRWYPRLSNPSSAQGTEAIVRLAAGQHQQGMALLRLAHARNAAGQSSSRRMLETARAYHASGRTDEALRIITAARELHPSSATLASAFTSMTRQRDPLDAFARQIDSLRAAHHIPGLAAVMLRDTSIVFARAFGMADVESGRKVTIDTPFNIASVTKPISAVVALRLAADGVLDLDRAMRSYKNFPEFCNDTRAEGGIFFSDYACLSDKLTLRHVLGMRANGQPGSRFLYNPPSYSWASRPMAEVTGRTFSQLVDSLVFRPAGMKHSARTNRQLPLPAALAGDLAIPYHVDSTGRVTRSTPPPPQGDGAAGGIISTAMDLARFDIALMSGKLIPPKFRAMLWQQDNPSIPYGLGWFLGNRDGKRVAWHTGLWEGRYSALYLKVLSDRADERSTLILLANSDGLRWPTELDEATIERSDFADAFFRARNIKATTSQPAR